MIHPVTYIKQPTESTNCAVQVSDEVQAWYKCGKLHRLGGPAVLHADGYEEWWVEGMRHRLDGPAVTWPDGRKQWFIDNVEMPDQLTGWIIHGLAG